MFVPDFVQPPLTEAEILAAFWPGGIVVTRTDAEITAKGLQIIPGADGEPLPDRLRSAHAEIRSGAGMGRPRFNQSLQELE